MKFETAMRPSMTARLIKWVLWILLIAGLGWGIWFAFFRSTEKPPASNNPATTPPISQSTQSSDAVAPSVMLQAIDNADAVSGLLTLHTTASDNQQVTKVEFYVDGVFMGITYSEPFTFVLDTTKLANGPHTITAKAYDESGNVASSEDIKITVANTVSETAASGGAAVKSKVQVSTTSNSTSQSSGGSGDSSSSSGGGTTSPPTPDTQSPTSPSNLLLSANDSYTSQLSWDPSTDNTAVTGYKVFRDGTQIGTSTTTSFKDQTVVPGNTYAYSVIAYDAASNNSAASNEPSITLAPTSIWIAADTPASIDSDPADYELGVKFRPLVNGKISGVKFYKGAGNTGTHIGKLWSSTGTPLASATFSAETATGWQTVAFSTPVDVTAGTTYVASYNAPNGHPAYTSSYFASAGITSQYLQALASGVDGNNGVFNATPGNFPSSSFSHTNYWIDVTFIPNTSAGGPAVKVADNSKVYPGYPGSDNTGVTVGLRLPTRDRKIDAIQDGIVVENIEVNAEINANANNVTIRNARVTAPTGGLIWGIKQLSGKSGLTVQDTEVYGNGTDQIGYGILDDGSGLTVERANIHTISDGIQSNSNLTITDSFVHDLFYFSGDHNDSFLMTGGNGATLTHNTLHNPLNQTAALGLFCDFSAIENVTATNNLLIGGGYTVYGGGNGSACSASHDIKFINNRFSRDVWPNGGFNGPVTGFNGAQSGSQWTGNVWDDDNTPVLP